MSFLVQITARSIAKLLWSLRLPRFGDARAVRGYRPERYYIRGPGPQWHAKHDALAHTPQGTASGLPKLR